MAFSFCILAPLALREPWDSHRRTLEKQWKGIMYIGAFMALNIALNNISLLDISLTLNQIIRWVGCAQGLQRACWRGVRGRQHEPQREGHAWLRGQLLGGQGVKVVCVVGKQSKPAASCTVHERRSGLYVQTTHACMHSLCCHPARHLMLGTRLRRTLCLVTRAPCPASPCCRSAIPVVTCLLAILVESRYPSRQELGALVTLTVGVMLAVWQGTVTGKPYAIVFCLIGTVCNGAMMTFSGKVLR